ncbi:MAG: hypothetical protein ACPL88_12835, partial [Bryobacteraceae bacterium]
AIFCAAGRAWIEHGGTRVWESEPDWRIVDVAPADVEGDLRAELLLALWKAGPDGVERSHPYLVGYRRGRYDLLWGGSAAPQPIVALEFWDVDADGRGELVVLEAPAGNGPGAQGHWVSIWRWNGWGFSLLWRSEEGRFRDLRLCDVDGDGAREVLVEMGH